MENILIFEFLKVEYAILVWLIFAVIAISGFFPSIKSNYDFLLWLKILKNNSSEQINYSKRASMKAIFGIVSVGIVWVAHLYDKLTKIYGRRKEYDNIFELFEKALLDIDLINLNKRHKKRVRKEFTMRLERTKKRALLS